MYHIYGTIGNTKIPPCLINFYSKIINVNIIINDKIFVNTCTSWVPCEKFNLAMFIPFSISSEMIFGSLEAGPKYKNSKRSEVHDAHNWPMLKGGTPTNFQLWDNSKLCRLRYTFIVWQNKILVQMSIHSRWVCRYVGIRWFNVLEFVKEIFFPFFFFQLMILNPLIIC